ncbi:hypothetical protein ACR9E3_17085 [Actinomycetospora sp. C-140]
MTSTITGVTALAALTSLPSWRGMTPAEARAAQVLGMAWEPAEIVELAIEWVGAGLDAASLVDLAGRGWDDPAVPLLWDLALDDLGAAHPTPRTADRLLSAYLARRTERAARIPAPRCTHCGTVGTAGTVGTPA